MVSIVIIAIITTIIITIVIWLSFFVILKAYLEWIHTMRTECSVLIGWVFFNKLSGCGFELRCSHFIIIIVIISITINIIAIFITLFLIIIINMITLVVLW